MTAKLLITALIAAVLGAGVGIALSGKASETAEATEKSRREWEQKMSGLTERLERIEIENQTLRGANRDLTAANASLRETRDSCAARWERGTYLYEGIFTQSRKWYIPVDVKPVWVGGGSNASYTHYDPKTQTETVRLQPGRQ